MLYNRSKKIYHYREENTILHFNLSHCNIPYKGLPVMPPIC